MELIQGKHENILAVGQTERENGALLTKDKLLQQYPDVFNGTGKIDGKYHLHGTKKRIYRTSKVKSNGR